MSNPVAGFVVPGSRVDILASYKEEDQLRALPLLLDVLVLAIDTYAERERTVCTVSFAVTQEQALLLMLAKQRGCYFELLLRQPGKPTDPDYDIRKVKKLLGGSEWLPAAPAPRPRGAGP
jgi:Flp pilus assembly protein CpaB